MGILSVLELGRGKLLFPVINDISPLGVDSVVILPHHDCWLCLKLNLMLSIWIFGG
jgi:hypothetical protein